MVKTFAAVVGFFMLSGAASGQQLYVAATGSDATGCEQVTPCRQIRRAISLAGQGTTINVADGSYLGFDLTGKPGVTIKATGTAAVVTKTTDRPDNRDTILIRSSDTVIDGLRSSAANRAALRVDTSNNVTVRNCVFSANAVWGIFTNHSDDLLIENNETFGSVAEHGIYVSNSGDRPVVRGNRSHDNAGAGIQLNADVTSGGDGIINGALIENNILWNNGTAGGSAINLDGVIESTIRNNLLYQNRATGIGMFQINGATGPRNNQILHNTVDQPAAARHAVYVANTTGPITSRNNVLYHANPNRGAYNCVESADFANLNSDYNVLDRMTPDDDGSLLTLAQLKAMGRETHSLSAAPAQLFVNPAGGDYHLSPSSAAKDAGLTLPSVTRDLDGTPRPAGAASDIGAYESGPPAPAGNVRATLTWTDNSTNEQGFHVERKTGGGAYDQVADVGANVVTWNEQGLLTDTMYCYQVVAFNASGAAAPSNESCGMVPGQGPIPIPNPASGLDATLELVNP